MSKDFSVKKYDYKLPHNTFVPDATRVSKPVVKIFPQKKNLNPPKELLFKTSSGKVYDLKQLINARNFTLNNKVFDDLRNNTRFRNNINDWCKKYLLGYQLSSQEMKDFIFYLYEKVKNANNIKDLFEYATGKKYTQENLDKFVKGEISLKIEQEYLMYAKEKAPQTKSTPYIKKNYQENIDLVKSEGMSYKLNPKQQVKYNIINKALDTEYQKKLSKALKYGKLTDDKTDTNSVLDSLHKILITPRVKGLDSVKLVKECLDILENPNIITQITEDIPKEYLEQAVKRYYDAIDKRELNIETQKYNLEKPGDKKQYINKDGSLKQLTKQDKEEYIRHALEYRTVGTCAAASLEYYLAVNQPANFFNMVEKLTSIDGKITKKYISQQQLMTSLPIVLTGLQVSPAACMPAETQTLSEQVELRADKEAYNLAKIQNNHKDKHERSMVDILTQSMIMNLGANGKYNSLIDRRYSDQYYKREDTGLYDYEINYAKDVLTGNENELKLYVSRFFNSNKKTPKSVIKNDILKALKRGDKIVIGLVVDNNGHEITIIDHTTNDNGDAFFVCQDSCDADGKPCVYDEDFILSYIDSAHYKKYKSPSPPDCIKELEKTISIPPMLYNKEQIFVLNNKIITPWNKQNEQENFFIQNSLMIK